jgi:nitrate reductase assembly molybdenum cofactor insertion protein NarJ
VIHSVDDLPDYLPLNLLFIATWSLSEAPLEVRNKIAENCLEPTI